MGRGKMQWPTMVRILFFARLVRSVFFAGSSDEVQGETNWDSLFAVSLAQTKPEPFS